MKKTTCIFPKHKNTGTLKHCNGIHVYFPLETRPEKTIKLSLQLSESFGIQTINVDSQYLAHTPYSTCFLLIAPIKFTTLTKI